MATVRADILNDLVTTVGAITELAAAGGCLRFTEDGVSMATVPVAYVHWTADTVQDGPVGYYTRRLACQVTVIYDTETGSTSDEQNDVWVGKVEAAVMADRSRNGKAVDTLLLSSGPLPAVESAPGTGVFVSLEIVYQTNDLDG